MDKQAVLNQVRAEAFDDELQKIAEEIELAKEQPGWWTRRMGAARATAGVLPFAKKDLIKKRFKSGLPYMGAGIGIGAGAGAAIGALAGGRGGRRFGSAMGALIGGPIGGGFGSSIGIGKANQKWLAERGIKSGVMGLNPKFSEAAIKKYIKEKQKG